MTYVETYVRMDGTDITHVLHPWDGKKQEWESDLLELQFIGPGSTVHLILSLRQLKDLQQILGHRVPVLERALARKARKEEYERKSGG